MLEGKKVLLTGLTGRIGQAVATRFAPLCEIWGLARYSREGSWEEAARLGVKPVRGDFAFGALDGVPDDFDYVLHIAADVYAEDVASALAANCDGVAHLMRHCRSAKAFLHVSTTGVYKQHSNPYHVYGEGADIGGGGLYGGQYVPTKIAGEGAARAGCLILDLPTVICRQNVQYGGPHLKAGLIDRTLDLFVETGEVAVPSHGPTVMAPFHEDDICDVIEPSLGIASVPASIVNWSGDDALEWREIFEYAGQLIGKPPKFTINPDFLLPNCVPDTSKRRTIAGPTKVRWKEGIRRSLALRHPGIALRPAN
jgi:nucleoside-diphosphate-sugar epimerase